MHQQDEPANGSWPAPLLSLLHTNVSQHCKKWLISDVNMPKKSIWCFIRALFENLTLFSFMLLFTKWFWSKNQINISTLFWNSEYCCFKMCILLTSLECAPSHLKSKVNSFQWAVNQGCKVNTANNVFINKTFTALFMLYKELP